MPSWNHFGRAAVSLLLVGLFVTPSFGWWETGHRAIARVAAAHLSPSARTAISRVLGVADTPEAVSDAMAQASTWADEHKKDTNTGEWHYIDIALQDKEKQIDERCPNDNCVTARIRLFKEQLKRKEPSGRWTEQDALRFLVHFVGDIHQPLHTVDDADLGGNCEQIKPFGTAKNLHALWDGGMLAQLETDDRRLSKGLNQYIDQLSKGKQKKLAKGDERDWTWESHKLAQEVIYQKLHIPLAPPTFPKNCEQAPPEIRQFHPEIDSMYFNEMKPILRDQLMKAGMRLAKVLNEAL